jgi:hypothetical protein
MLRPRGIIPEGIKVAEDLDARCWPDSGARPGTGCCSPAFSSPLSGTIHVQSGRLGPVVCRCHAAAFSPAAAIGQDRRLAGLLSSRTGLKNLYSMTITALFPLIVFFLVRDPVRLLSAAGIITAVHMPVLILLTHYVNTRLLPKELRPGAVISGVMLLSGLVYIVIAVLYLLNALR